MSQMNQSPVQPPREPSRIRRMLVELATMAINNWPTKLLALVLAIALWGGLITQDPSLTRERTFRNVAVSINGSDTLKRNGLIVTSDLNELLNDVTIVVNVPQMQYANAQASNFNARIDLTRIKQAGEQEISILTTNSSTYGKVAEVEPATVRVMVEEYESVGFIPVNVVQSGEAPAGYYVGEMTCDPARITVSGPKSLVDRVVRAEVVIEQSELPAREGTVENAVSFSLLDRNGDVIDSDMLQVTSDSVLRSHINVSIQMYAKREIDLQSDPTALYRGRPADGYEVTEVIVSPQIVTLAGKQSIIDSVSTLSAQTPMSISGSSETVSGTVELKSLVNVVSMSAKQAAVTVVIQPIREERRFTSVPLTISNVPEGMTAAGPYTATVIVNGPQTWIGTLKKSSLSVSCDAEGLAEGEHELPLVCEIADSVGIDYTIEIDPAIVRVTISANDE